MEAILTGKVLKNEKCIQPSSRYTAGNGLSDGNAVRGGLSHDRFLPVSYCHCVTDSADAAGTGRRLASFNKADKKWQGAVDRGQVSDISYCGVFLLVVLFYGTNYLVAGAMDLLGRGDAAIQSLDGYMANPFAISINTYFYLFLLCKWIAVTAVSSVFFLFLYLLPQSGLFDTVHCDSFYR